MTREERETTLGNISAVIESADPPAWAGLPLPEKKPLMRRLCEYVVNRLS
jgi:hypothetical protein